MVCILNLCFLFRRPSPLHLSLVSNYSLQFLEPCSDIFIIFFLSSVWNKFWKTQEINLRSSLFLFTTLEIPYTSLQFYVRFTVLKVKRWSRSVMSDSVTPWTIAHHAPSMEFSRQEYWSGLPFPSPGDLPTQGSNPGLLHCRQMLYHLSHQGIPTFLRSHSVFLSTFYWWLVIIPNETLPL